MISIDFFDLGAVVVERAGTYYGSRGYVEVRRRARHHPHAIGVAWAPLGYRGVTQCPPIGPYSSPNLNEQHSTVIAAFKEVLHSCSDKINHLHRK